MKACFTHQMRQADADAINLWGIPGVVLMENAALCCVRELEKEFHSLKSKKAALFCGKGNNGGDGFAIARHLINQGAEVIVFLTGGREFSGDAQTNFSILEKMPCTITEDISLLEYQLPGFDFVVDAMYGTGIQGEIRGAAYEVIEEINRKARYVLSVDIPSGVNGDSGELCGICVKADKTVTFAAYKVGMLLFPGKEYTGEVVLGDISMPASVLAEFPIQITDAAFANAAFPTRRDNSQKGDYGKVLIIGGSKGMTGAACLSAQAALVTGSGLVTAGICESLNPILEEKLTEVMTVPLAEANGTLSAACAPEILERMKRADAVLFGPGLGRSSEIRRLLEILLPACEIPMVLDADGLNVLSENMELLDDCSCNLVMTPHTVELSRLSGYETSYIEENRIAVSGEFAQENGVTLLLKGHHTIVTAMNGAQYINITGNSGMATGGSGDVLAGILVSLLGRGVEEAKAAALAVYLHGRAGDICALRVGQDSVTATGILRHIPDAIQELTR